MKIKKLVVKNYKVFDHLELDFTDKNGQVLDTIVLAGLNGCGKTTVLELLKDLIEGKEPNHLDVTTEIEIELLIPVIEEIKKYINTNYDNIMSISSFSTAFDILFFSYKYGNNNKDLFSYLGYEINKIVEHFEYRIEHFLITPPQAIYLYNSKSIPTEEKRLKNIFMLSFNTHSNFIKSTILEELQKKVFEAPDLTPRYIFSKQVYELNAIFNNLDINSKLVEVNNKELTFKSINGKKISFDDLSSGEKTLYFMGFILNQLNPKDALIMVDEPEDSLHPRWQQQIVRFFNNVGSNNQVILATHSPHIIGSVNAENVFFLEIDENQIEAVHPKYTKGHSIDYILEVMGANPRNTMVINKINAYLALVRKGLSETEQGKALKAEIDAFNLDPNSEEMRRLDLSLKRFKSVGV